MAFQDDLRRYLEELLDGGPEAPRSTFAPDLRLHRQHLLRELERLEAAGMAKDVLKARHAVWSDRVDSFAKQVGALLVNGIAHGAPAGEVTNLINLALSRDLGLGTSTGSVVKDAEIDRLLTEMVRTAPKGSGEAVATYATEIRAVRRKGLGREVTPLGRIATELPDRDVLRWLLTVEAAQSRGDGDPWRLSRTAAADLCKRPRFHYLIQPDPRPIHSLLHDEAVERLRLMGILQDTLMAGDDGAPYGIEYHVVTSALPLLEEIAFAQETPFSVVISALLSDETTNTLGPLPRVPRLPTASAAAATTRHARMVAHEIRNALVPVQGALDALYRDAVRRGGEALVDPHRGAIDQGIDRVFTFIKDMMEVAERGAEPPGAFGVAPAIQDAIAAATSELGGSVAFEAGRALPALTGHRNRFTLALVNLLRNALQIEAAPPLTVRVSADLADGDAEVVVLVEDSGPGVPADQRTAIFQQGFSLRPGGTGQGLALVREVVESEMGGRATCEESPLGGARFVLRVPVTGRTAR